MKNYHFEGDQEEMTQFLSMIKRISDHHHSDENFIQKINKILEFYNEQIKQTLSNDELFHKYENNKLIILFLLKNDVIRISDFIYKDIINKNESNGSCYYHFFYPDLLQYKGEDEVVSQFNATIQ